LPSIYLLDSITKNVGAPYTAIFARNLYKTFMGIYTSVEPPLRKKLEDLFQTWTRPVVGSLSTEPVFPPEATQKIEETLRRIRESQQRHEPAVASMYPSGIPPLSAPPISFNPIADVQRDITTLMHTFAQRLQIEPRDTVTHNHLRSLSALQQLLQTSVLPPAQLHEVMRQIQVLKQHEAMTGGPRIPPPVPIPGYGSPVPSVFPPPIPIPGQTFPTAARPRIELKSAAMLPSRPELIHLLYGAKPLQCGLCGQRWHDTNEGRAARDAHLDWHFKVNKRLREHAVRGQSRALYLSEQDWISFTIGDHAEDEANAIQPGAIGSNNKKANGLTLEEANKRTVPKPSDPALHDSECPVCREKFVTDWDDATEDWVWKNAVMAGGTIYHATCHHEAMSSNTKAAAAAAVPKSALQAGNESSDDEDVPLPGARIKEEPGVNGEAESKPDVAAMPVMLDAAALASLYGSISAMTAAAGAKRKAEEDSSDTGRRVKQEPDL
jgi:pre-mRNA cleavage complex 2 protein Pcf11